MPLSSKLELAVYIDLEAWRGCLDTKGCLESAGFLVDLVTRSS